MAGGDWPTHRRYAQPWDSDPKAADLFTFPYREDLAHKPLIFNFLPIGFLQQSLLPQKSVAALSCNRLQLLEVLYSIIFSGKVDPSWMFKPFEFCVGSLCSRVS
jgi:hypothetical protein